jgi:P-type E1-E2 ATPase
VVAAARAKGLGLPAATGITDSPGRGVRGVVGGREVLVGALPFLAERWPEGASRFTPAAGLVAYVMIDGAPAAVLHFADRVRPDTRETLEALRALGITRILLLSGDHGTNTAEVARVLGIAEARGDLLPGDKLAAIRDLQQIGERVVMVGDGTNDAPALSAAEVGVALAEHGGGVSAEAAGLVLLRDDLRQLPQAIRLARRTVRVARQSIGAGLGLSLVGMAVAAAGFLTPVAGAITQEVIDVTVILWALRSAAPLPAEGEG